MSEAVTETQEAGIPDRGSLKERAKKQTKATQPEPGKASEILAATNELELDCVTYYLTELDLNDIADLERVQGSAGEFFEGLEKGSMDAIRVLGWLMLRKADPDLTDAERNACRYKMSLLDFGKMFPLRRLADLMELQGQLLSYSGLLPTETPNPNEPGGPSETETPSTGGD